MSYRFPMALSTFYSFHHLSIKGKLRRENVRHIPKSAPSNLPFYSWLLILWDLTLNEKYIIKNMAHNYFVGDYIGRKHHNNKETKFHTISY